jgi:twitching motility two-component system response regulator PilH
MLSGQSMVVRHGFEVLKKLKKNPETKNIPVVILSNYGEMPNITEGLMSGAVEYLIKVEHTPEEVVDVVIDAMQEKDSLIGKAFKETA